MGKKTMKTIGKIAFSLLLVFLILAMLFYMVQLINILLEIRKYMSHP